MTIDLRTEERLACGCTMGPDGFITRMCDECYREYTDAMVALWEAEQLRIANE